MPTKEKSIEDNSINRIKEKMRRGSIIDFDAMILFASIRIVIKPPVFERAKFSFLTSKFFIGTFERNH